MKADVPIMEKLLKIQREDDLFSTDKATGRY